MEEYERLEEEAEASLVDKTHYFYSYVGCVEEYEWLAEETDASPHVQYKTTTTPDYTLALILILCRLQWRNMSG